MEPYRQFPEVRTANLRASYMPSLEVTLYGSAAYNCPFGRYLLPFLLNVQECIGLSEGFLCVPQAGSRNCTTKKNPRFRLFDRPLSEPTEFETTIVRYQQLIEQCQINTVSRMATAACRRRESLPLTQNRSQGRGMAMIVGTATHEN